MALNDQMNHPEALWQFMGADDEETWENIVKCLNRGTTPYLIRTGQPFQDLTYDPARITWGGIEGEGRFVGAPAMDRGALTMIRTNGCPRIVMPDAATSDVWVPIELEEWWLKDPLLLQFEWVNDAAGTGNVRFQYDFRQINIGLQGPATASSLLTRTVTEPSLAAGIMTTSIIANPDFGHVAQPNPGGLAAYYDLRITRLGNDGADTLSGSVGLAAASWVRYTEAPD